MSSAVILGAAAGALVGVAAGELWLAGGADPGAGDRGRDGSEGSAPTPTPTSASAFTRALASRARGGRAPVVVAGAAIGWALLGAIGVVAGAGVAIVAVRQLMATGRSRAARARERGVGALARSIADGIRGGRSIRAALQQAATDRSVTGALRTEVGRADAALIRGTTLPAALADLGRAGGPQLTLLAAITALHAERGGALARELDALADDADRAVRLDEERASSTAQARATVRTVAALPIFALAAAQLLGGNLLGSVAGHPAALALLVVGLLLEVVAVLVARSLVARTA